MSLKFSREERIKQLKDCGQSIIDNAERIASDFKYPIGVKVIIDIQPHEVPTITAERNFYAEKFIDDMKGGQ